MLHLNSLLPYQDTRESMENQQAYFLFRPLIAYLSTQVKKDLPLEVVTLYLIFVSDQLADYKTYLRDLPRYRARDSLFKEKDAKAHTHMCRTYSMAQNSPKGIKDDEIEADKHYYWEMLMWIPFYVEPQGLLLLLQRLALLILEKQHSSDTIDLNMDRI